MRIDPDPQLVERARGGDLAALDGLLRALEGPVHQLSVRMLGVRADAEDATQEILLKVTTHLATYRAESPFGTWVFSIASNHLLNAKRRGPARREVSFDVLGTELDRGLAFHARLDERGTALSPEDKLEARRTALSCTQAMLVCLPPPQRLSYLLDVVFGLSASEAGEVLGIAPAAHRQRVARARQALDAFTEQRCGLIDASAPCRCAHQVPAKRWARAQGLAHPGLEVSDAELDDAHAGLVELIALGDAAAVIRGAPRYAAPTAMIEGIRAVLERARVLRDPGDSPPGDA